MSHIVMSHIVMSRAVMSRVVNSRSIGIVRALAALAMLSLSACSSPDERARDYYQRGMTFLAKNDAARAGIELKSALQIKGDFVPALRALAGIEEGRRDWQAVGTILRRIAALEQSDIDVRLRLARLSLLAGAFRGALEWTDAAITIDKKHGGAMALRALILLKTDDESGAIGEAQRALEIDRDNVEATMVLAAARLAHDDANGALRILDRIPTVPDRDFGLDLFRINIYDKLGNLEQVQQRLQRLVELHPQESAPRAQLLKFYLAHQHADEAEQLLRSIAAANPTDSKAGLDVVRFLNIMKGRAAARQELLARMKAGGDVFPYQLALAELELAEGNFAAAANRIEGLLHDLKDTGRILAARVLLAQAHVAAKDFEAAEPIIGDILRRDARNESALRLRAFIRLEQSLPDDAVTDLRQALSDQPRSPELMSLLAVAYERAGSIELAERQFADAARVSDFASAFGLDYEAFLQRRGRIAEAEDVLTDLARRHPADVSVLSSLAQIRLARQNWAGAREVAEAIRALDQRALADQILAAALAGQKKYADSIAVLEDANAASPGGSQLMFALVRSYLSARRIDKAEAFLALELRKNSGNAEALVLRGLVETAANVPNAAVKSFKAAIAAQPKDAVGYRALAELYTNRKEYDEALNVVQAGLREQPASFQLGMARAGILELKGDAEAAIEQYENLLKEQPGSLVVANNLASLMSEHRTDKASLARAYAVAKSLAKSQVPQFKDTLGWISYLRGDTRTAIPLLEEATAELPNNPLVRYHLAMSYAAIGQAEKAKGELQRASELLPPEGGPLAEKILAALKG
jgi:cellulose synthase operon protein C